MPAKARVLEGREGAEMTDTPKLTIIADPDDEFKLCYCTKAWAYFTTLDPAEQLGDDWHRRSDFENSPPYEPSYDMDFDESGKPKWRIKKVAWDGEFDLPNSWERSAYSIEEVNRGFCAWLVPARYGPPNSLAKPIPAGTTLNEFRRLIRLHGGRVYEERT